MASPFSVLTWLCSWHDLTTSIIEQRWMKLRSAVIRPLDLAELTGGKSQIQPSISTVMTALSMIWPALATQGWPHASTSHEGRTIQNNVSEAALFTYLLAAGSWDPSTPSTSVVVDPGICLKWENERKHKQ